MCNRKRGGEVQEEEWKNNALNQTQTKELTAKKKKGKEGTSWGNAEICIVVTKEISLWKQKRAVRNSNYIRRSVTLLRFATT